MLSGQRSAWRRRGGNSRAARLAVPLAIPMALGLTLGIILAVSGGNSSRIDQSALGADASASASPSGLVAASGAAAPTVGAAAAAAAPAAAANVNCDIIVPANPLSARGLATPYQLTGPGGTTPAASGCTMANAANLGAFVQATILNPRTGALSVYNPLVVTAGDHAGRPAGGAEAAAARDRHHRLRVQRHGPDPGGRDAQRAGPGQLRQRPGLGLRPGVVLQRHQLLQHGVAADARGAAVRSRGRALGQDRADGGPARHRHHLSDRPQLRHGRPGPERQRDQHLPAQPDHRPDRAGHRGQRGQPDGLAEAGQRQRQRPDRRLHGPDARVYPVHGPRPGEQQHADDLTGARRAPGGQEPAEGRRPGAGERRNGAGRQRPARPGQDQPLPRGGRPGAGQRAEQPERQPGELLPEHGQHPDPVPGG